MDSITRRITDYVLSLRYEDLTHASLYEAKKHLLDSVACAMGGLDTEPVRIARRFAAGSADTPPARILGSGHFASMETATFVNTVMIRCLDYNDTYLSVGVGHPSDMIAAVLAVADAHHRTGKDFLTAMAVAYEVFGALSDAASVSARGWDSGVFLGLGAAAGAGRLLGLDGRQMANALGITATANVPTRQARFGEISMWKGCATAAAARMGIFAALLAKEGMTGPGDAFEGRYGLLNQATGPFELKTLGAGGPSAVERTHLKWLPVEYHASAMVSAALHLREKMDREDIDAINVETYYIAFREICSEPEKWDPKTPEAADHSLPYLLAIALQDGSVTTRSFTEERVLDPALRPLMNRIRIVENPEFTRQYPQSLRSRIEIVTKDGSRHAEEAGCPKGHVLNPMSDADVEQKLNDLSQGKLTPAQTREVCRVFQALENVGDMSAPLALLVSAPR